MFVFRNRCFRVCFFSRVITYQKWRFSIATLVYQSVIWLETIPKALEKSHTLPSLAIVANQINQDFGER